MPARKLELYQVFLSKEELRGQVEPGKNSQCLTPEPTPAPVSVLTVTQVSLGEGGGLPPRATWSGALIFLLSGGATTLLGRVSVSGHIRVLARGGARERSLLFLPCQ